MGIRIELHELAGELFQQMVRDDIHRFLNEARLFHLHAGGGHRERLSRSDRVGQQRVPRTHPSPNRIDLMRAERQRLVEAGEVEMRAVELTRPQIVVRVVVQPNETLGSLRIGEDPGPELFFDESLLLTGRQRFHLVDDFHFINGVVHDRRFHVEGQTQQPRSVGTSGSIIRGRRHRAFRPVVGFKGPHRILHQMADWDR